MANYKPTIGIREAFVEMHQGYDASISSASCSTRVLGVCIGGGEEKSSLSLDLLVVQEAMPTVVKMFEDLIMMRSDRRHEANNKKKKSKGSKTTAELGEQEDEACPFYSYLLHGDWEEDEDGESRLSLTDTEIRNLKSMEFAIRSKYKQFQRAANRRMWTANVVLSQGIQQIIQVKFLKVVRWVCFILGGICGLFMLCGCFCMKKLMGALFGSKKQKQG